MSREYVHRPHTHMTHIYILLSLSYAMWGNWGRVWRGRCLFDKFEYGDRDSFPQRCSDHIRSSVLRKGVLWSHRTGKRTMGLHLKIAYTNDVKFTSVKHKVEGDGDGGGVRCNQLRHQLERPSRSPRLEMKAVRDRSE